MDPLSCYECCVQSPRHVVNFLHAVYRLATGDSATILHEDFAGSAAFSRRWVADGLKRADGSRALAIDYDPLALAHARSRATAEGVPISEPPHSPRPGTMTLAQADQTKLPAHLASAPADVVFVGNFSIGYLHTRAALLSYLRSAKKRLDASRAGFGGGVLVVDTYGGAGAFRLGGLTRTHTGPRGEVIHYHWQHESADPRTNLVTNSISLRVIVNGEQIAEWPRAFVYHWRLWSIAELREAMAEVGFSRSEVFTDVNLPPDADAVPIQSADELTGDGREDWIVLIAAW